MHSPIISSSIYFVQAMPEKSETPSNFSLKLRKHLRTRRIEAISQLGCDRMVQLTFGTGDKAHHLILEFYAQGNVVLTDHKYLVLTLLRSHRDDAKGIAIMARHTYPIQTVRLRQVTTAAALEAALQQGAEGGGIGEKEEQEGEGAEGVGGGKQAGGKQQKGGSGGSDVGTLKTAVAELLRFGPMIAEHCILKAGMQPGRKLDSEPLDDAERAALLSGIRSWEQWLEACEAAPPGGAILTKPAPAALKKEADQDQDPGSSGGNNNEKEDVVYEEFEILMEGQTPIEQHTNRDMIKFATYDDAISEFFGKVRQSTPFFLYTPCQKMSIYIYIYHSKILTNKY